MIKIKNKDLISIIIPVYNVEKYLLKCLDSVVNQSYTNIEVIIINDGSTDNSLNIARKFSDDSRIKIINKNNEGLSIARQTGIENATGKYLCTIDSDDYIHEEYVEKLYESISKSSSDIAIAGRIDFSEKRQIKHPLKTGIPSEKIITKDEIQNSYYSYSLAYNMSDSWDKMYRLEFIKSTNVIFELNNKYNGTDLLFNNLLLLHTPKICTVNENLYYHRSDNTNSRVHRTNKNMAEGFRVITDRIIFEANKLKYGDEFDVEISKLYYTLQFQAFRDEFHENRFDKRSYSEYLNKNEEYIYNNDRIKYIQASKLNLSILNTQLAIKNKNINKLLIHVLFSELRTKFKI